MNHNATALPLLFAGIDISMLFYTYILVCLKLSTNMDKEAQVMENHLTKTSVTARGFMIFDQKINEVMVDAIHSCISKLMLTHKNINYITLAILKIKGEQKKRFNFDYHIFRLINAQRLLCATIFS